MVYLGAPYSFINLGIQLVTPSHLTDVHPAVEPRLLQSLPHSLYFILTVPLITDEYLGWFQVTFCNNNRYVKWKIVSRTDSAFHACSCINAYWLKPNTQETSNVF